MLPGIAPPQKPRSIQAWPSAVFRLASSPATVVVGGTELSGMSMTVVTPPAAAARVAVAKPSHSVRPGSLTCTWVSTRPGSRAVSPRSVRRSSPTSSEPYAAICSIRPSWISTSAGRSPSGRTTRRERITAVATGSPLRDGSLSGIKTSGLR